MISYLEKLRLRFSLMRIEGLMSRSRQLLVLHVLPILGKMILLVGALLTRLHKVTVWASAHISGVRVRSLCTIKPTTRILSSATINNILGLPQAITVGEYTYVRGELTTFGHGGEIHIGDYCYVGEGTRIWSAASIRIGNRVLISHNVNIFDNDTHPIEDAAARHRQFVEIISVGHPRQINLNEAPVIIEDDAFIACQSVILSGVHIGRGAVVAAGSVVTCDVPSFTMVAGNPARVIKTIVRET